MKLSDNLYMYPEQGVIDSNTYIVTGRSGIIIDPGSSMYLPALIQAMKQDGIEPGDIGTIVGTHLHGDHCGASEKFRELSGASIALHPVQKENYRTAVIEAARFFGVRPDEFEEDEILEGDSLTAGDVKIEMIPSPGHSPDSVCYYLPETKALVCGDVLFEMSTGRTDLPGGNGQELKASIESLSCLDIERLLPGHMGAVTGSDRVGANFEFIRSNIFSWL